MDEEEDISYENVYTLGDLIESDVTGSDLCSKYGEYHMTWRAIGEELGVTRQRAMQIAAKAMRKLRARNPHLKHLLP